MGSSRGGGWGGRQSHQYRTIFSSECVNNYVCDVAGAPSSCGGTVLRPSEVLVGGQKRERECVCVFVGGEDILAHNFKGLLRGVKTWLEVG